MSDRLDRHIVLYSKYHYPRSGRGALSDLKDLLSVYSWTERKYYESRYEELNIYRLVLETAINFAPKYAIISTLRDLFSFNYRDQKMQFLPDEVGIEDVVSRLLSAMGLTSVDDFPYDIGEADEKLREGMLKLQNKDLTIVE